MANISTKYTFLIVEYLSFGLTKLDSGSITHSLQFGVFLYELCSQGLSRDAVHNMRGFHILAWTRLDFLSGMF